MRSDNLARLIMPYVANGRDAVAPLPSDPLTSLANRPTDQPINLLISLQPPLPTGQLVNRPASLPLWPTGQLINESTY